MDVRAAAAAVLVLCHAHFCLRCLQTAFAIANILWILSCSTQRIMQLMLFSELCGVRGCPCVHST